MWLREIPIIIHLTARDEGSVRSVYNHIEEMGQKRVSDVLVLRGDPTPIHSREVDSYKFSTVELAKLISDYKNEHSYAIDILVAGHPEFPDHALAKHMAYQKRKIESGAGGIITNIVTDHTRYAKYVEAAQAHGLNVPIVPSVIPLTSLRRCEFLETRLHISVPQEIKERLSEASKEDAVKIGVEAATHIARRLLAYGALGINFSVIFPRDVGSVAEILRALRGHATIWEKYRIEDPEEIDYYNALREWRS